MSERLGIKVDVDFVSEQTIQKNLDKLLSKVKLTYKLNVDYDKKQVMQIAKDINNQLKGLLKEQVGFDLGKVESQLKKAKEKMSQPVGDLGYKNYEGTLDKQSAQYKEIANQGKYLQKVMREYTNDIGETVKVTETLDRATGNVVSRVEKITESFKEQDKVKLANIKSAYDDISNQIKLINDLQTKSLSVGKEEQLIIKNKIQELGQLYSASRLELRDNEFITKEYEQQLKLLKEQQRFQYDRKSSSLIDKNSAKEEAKLARQQVSMKDALTKLPFWIGAYELYHKTFDVLKSGVNVVRELDTAMVDLKKVTSETDSTYDSFLKTANNMGQQIGKTTKEVVDATTEWVKTGQSLSDAQTLAKTTLVGANVGDIDVKSMQEYLITPLKAFNKTADESMGILDVMNRTSNEHAITIQTLGEAYQRASSVMALTGNSLEETTALITAAEAKTKMGGEVVGNAFKTIALNMQSMKADKSGNLFEKYEKTVNRMGISLKDTSGEFKNTYEIVQDLAKVWENFDDQKETQTYVLEQLAGKRQANILAATITNFKEAEETKEKAMNATGSAMKEQAKYAESIEFRINKVKTAWEGLALNFINSDMVKGVLDLTYNFLTFLNTLDGADLKVMALTSALLGLAKLSTTQIGIQLASSITGVATSATKATATVNTLKFAFMGLNLTAGAWLAIGAAVVGGVWLLYDAMTVSNKEMIAGNQKILDRINTEKQHLDSIKDIIKENEKLSASDKEYISKQIPEAIAGYDAQGNAILKNKDAINELIDAKEREQGVSANNNTLKSGDRYIENTKQIKEYAKQIKALKKEQDNLKSEGYIEGQTNNYLKVSNEIEGLSKKIKKLGGDNSQLKDQFIQMSQSVDLSAMSVSDLNNLYNQSIAIMGTKNNQFALNVQLLARAKSETSELAKFESILKNEHKLSAQQMRDLAKIIPGVTDLRNDDATALLNLITASNQSRQEMIKDQNALSKASYEQTKYRIQLIKSEISAMAGVSAKMAQQLDLLARGVKGVQTPSTKDLLGTGTMTQIIGLGAKVNDLKNAYKDLAAIDNAVNNIKAPSAPSSSSAGGVKSPSSGGGSGSGSETKEVKELASTYDRLELAIKKEQDARKKHLEGSKPYVDSIKNEIGLHQQLIRAKQEEMKKMATNTKEYIDAQAQIVAWQSEINEIGVSEKQRVLEKQMELEEKAHDKRMDMLEKEHENRLSKYEEDYDKYEKNIKDKLKLLDDQYAQEDFQKELQKEQEKLMEIQMKMNELSYDNSVEAKSKMFDLQKQYSEQEEKIQDILTNKIRDDRKSNLEKQLESYQEGYDKIVENENNAYEKLKEVYEKQFENFQTANEDASKDSAIMNEINASGINPILQYLYDNASKFTAESVINTTEMQKIVQSALDIFNKIPKAIIPQVTTPTLQSTTSNATNGISSANVLTIGNLVNISGNVTNENLGKITTAVDNGISQLIDILNKNGKFSIVNGLS